MHCIMMRRRGPLSSAALSFVGSYFSWLMILGVKCGWLTRSSTIVVYSVQANFRPFVGSQRPSCAGPFVGRALPDDVGTAPTVPNLMPTSGVHIPDGGTLALVGFGAVKGVSACAPAPYCGFCASAFFCCCKDSEVACCRFRELMRVARSLQFRKCVTRVIPGQKPTSRSAMPQTFAGRQSCVHRRGNG